MTTYLIGLIGYLRERETVCPDCRELSPSGHRVEWHKWGCPSVPQPLPAWPTTALNDRPSR